MFSKSIESDFSLLREAVLQLAQGRLFGYLPYDLQEGLRRARVSVCAATHGPKRALVMEILDRNDYQLASLDFFLGATQRDEPHPHNRT